MRKSRFSKSQIVDILKEAEGGVAVAACCEHTELPGTRFQVAQQVPRGAGVGCERRRTPSLRCRRAGGMPR